MILVNIPTFTFNLIINIIGIFIIILILLNTKIKKGFMTIDKKLFLIMLFSNMITLIVDTFTWIFDKREGFEVANRITNSIYFMVNPALTLSWAVYLDYKIFGNVKNLKKRALIYSIPFIINFVLSFANLFTDTMFTILDGNVYQRMWGVYINSAVSYMYILFSLILTIVNKRIVSKGKFNALILFIILPIISSILQLAFYGISIIWVSEALSCLILFINFQNDDAVTDSLTKIYNRRYLEEYLSSKFRSNHKEYFYGIMIDIDGFKSINDMYGHLVGDQALKNMAKIITKSINANEVAIRFAGDEFIIIIPGVKESRIQEIISNLTDYTNVFNNSTKESYKLAFSLGYYITNSEDTIDTFIKRVDERMYIDKNRKK